MIKSLSGHKGFITSVCFSPNGMQIASGSNDKTIKLWESKIGYNIKTLSGHSNTVSDICFSNDCFNLLSGSYDKTVKIWDIESG